MTTTPTIWQGSQQANTTDSGAGGDDQTIPQLVGLANGTFIALWESNTDTGVGATNGTDIIGQLYDAEGAKVGVEFRANNSFTADDEGDFTAAALPNGNFVVAYEDTDSNGTSIRYSILGPAGASLSLNGTIELDSNADDLGGPSITANSDGSFLVAFQRRIDGADQTQTQGVIVSSAGVAGAAFSLASASSSTDVGAGGQQVATAVLTNGNYVIVNRDNGADPGFAMRIVTSTGGSVLGLTSVANTVSNGDTDVAPAVAALAGGGYVVAWQNTDSSDTDIEFQRFDAAGNEVGGIGTVNSGGSTDNNRTPKLVGLPDGGFVIVYDDNEGNKIALQRYSSTGAEVGLEVTVASTSGLGASLSQPTVSLTDDGRLLVGWTSALQTFNPVGFDNDVRFAIFDPRDNVINGDGSANVITSRLDGATVNGLGGADTLLGQGVADTLNGGDGNDTIRGRGGDDLIQGGLNADTIFGDDGNDTIFANTQAAPDLSVTGDTIDGGAGNDVIRGSAGADTIDGGADNDTIDGGGGADAMTGGSGNDTFTVDNAGDTVIETNGGGTDTVNASVSFSLVGREIETLNLTGVADINATGNEFTNEIAGNAGKNTIDGGGGADIMGGGAGDDTYVVDNSGDQVTEAAGGGNDTVNAGVSFALAAGSEVETINLTGAGNIDATGSNSANAINGNNGNNRLDGGAGADALAGGAGDDTYIVDNAGDTVTEAAGGGDDTVRASVAFSLIGQELENLVLTGAAAIDGTGNGLANSLTGNGAANALSGGAGNDTLDGGAGADALTGGTGDDTYVVDDAGDTVAEGNGEGTDTVNSSVTFSLAANFAENLVLTGAANIDATGNALANALTGNGGDNTLDGGTNADTMAGGLGDDTYVVDNAGDVVTELVAGGSDTVLAAISFSLAGLEVEKLTLTGAAANATGNAKDNSLKGNDAANRLDGGAGADTMAGGAGSDTYVVDNAGDNVLEADKNGADTVLASVSFSLAGTFVETLKLTGIGAINATGNGLANTITGNGAANKIDGGKGADSMSGGLGSDTYTVDSTSDKVIEAKSAGADKVLSSVSFTLGDNVENLSLTGTGKINATGNGLANTLAGNTGANRLDGKAGADTMAGNTGSDTYVVDNKGDKVVEGKNGGADTVLASVSFALGANVENLTLTGKGSVNATGNSLANTLAGNTGKNLIDGGAGNDKLKGGGGADSFLFDTALSSKNNVDSIGDFSSNDTIRLENKIFAGLKSGDLSDSAFKDLAEDGKDKDDRILYDSKKRDLYFDQDGSGKKFDAIKFAHLDSKFDLSADDFLVV